MYLAKDLCILGVFDKEINAMKTFLFWVLLGVFFAVSLSGCKGSG